MKKKFYIKTALLSLMSMALLSSCLKDNAHFVNFAGSKPLVELPAATGVAGTGEFQAVAFSITSTPTPLDLLVNVAAPKPLTTALNVKLIVDQAALSAYNAANIAAYKADSASAVASGSALPSYPTIYTLLPTADYSTTLAVTIPANQNSANLVININTSLIDPTQAYALPLTISDGGGQQISNYKTVIYNVQVKNAYDGEYTVTGSLTDNTTNTITGAYPEKVNLVTQGSSSDAFFDVTKQDFVHLIDAGASYYGSFAPVFTFNGNTVTSVTNYYGQFSGSHQRSAVLDPSGVNKFISGTPGVAGSVFQVSYFLEQGNPMAPRTQFTETYTYIGSR